MGKIAKGVNKINFTVLYGNYYYIIIENFPKKFSPCILLQRKNFVKSVRNHYENSDFFFFDKRLIIQFLALILHSLFPGLPTSGRNFLMTLKYLQHSFSVEEDVEPSDTIISKFHFLYYLFDYFERHFGDC